VQAFLVRCQNKTRRVQIAGLVRQPHGVWMKQVARNLTDDVDGFLKGMRYLIHDLVGVPKVTAHAMRGLFATLTAERGLAGHLIAATLGHEDERTTMNAYAALGAERRTTEQR
jgi:integrase